MSLRNRAFNHVREADPAAAGRAATIARCANELELGGDAEAAQQVGGKNGRAFEDHEQHKWCLDVSVCVRDLTTEAAHAPRDPRGADHGLAGAACCGSGLGLRQHFGHALLA